VSSLAVSSPSPSLPVNLELVNKEGTISQRIITARTCVVPFSTRPLHALSRANGGRCNLEGQSKDDPVLSWERRGHAKQFMIMGSISHLMSWEEANALVSEESSHFFIRRLPQASPFITTETINHLTTHFHRPWEVEMTLRFTSFFPRARALLLLQGSPLGWSRGTQSSAAVTRGEGGIQLRERRMMV
jgi:hypothetical protein